MLMTFLLFPGITGSLHPIPEQDDGRFQQCYVLDALVGISLPDGAHFIKSRSVASYTSDGVHWGQMGVMKHTGDRTSILDSPLTILCISTAEYGDRLGSRLVLRVVTFNRKTMRSIGVMGVPAPLT